MNRQHHSLKTAQEYFEEVRKGNKTFEVRFNDRNFRRGDILRLQEVFPDLTYTGRVIRAEVTYLLGGEQFCKAGYVIMGIKVLEVLEEV